MAAIASEVPFPDLPVLVTYSNFGYYKFAKNLLLNLSATLKYHKVHFYCIDTEILEALQALNITNIDLTLELYDVDVSKEFESYGSAAYNKVTHVKTSIVKDALTRFRYIHFIDCDIVCIKEPTAEYWAKYREYDIVFQYDGTFITSTKRSNPQFHIWACTGNVSFRDTPSTHRMLDIIIDYQKRGLDKNDQDCLYAYFRENRIHNLRQATIANLYEYPPEEFTNGYWVAHNIGGVGDTYFFHANHVIGEAAKLELLRKIDKLYI